MRSLGRGTECKRAARKRCRNIFQNPPSQVLGPPMQQTEGLEILRKMVILWPFSKIFCIFSAFLGPNSRDGGILSFFVFPGLRVVCATAQALEIIILGGLRGVVWQRSALQSGNDYRFLWPRPRFLSVFKANFALPLHTRRLPNRTLLFSNYFRLFLLCDYRTERFWKYLVLVRSVSRGLPNP